MSRFCSSPPPEAHLLTVRHLLFGFACLGLLAAPGSKVFAQAPEEVQIRIDASKRLNAISPLLYGHFVEFMFEGVKGGLWADRIENGSFETPAPSPAGSLWWRRYPDRRNHDPALSLGGATGLGQHGYPPGRENRAQVIASRADDNRSRGIYQDGIPVRKGLRYQGAVWLRGAGLQPDGQTVTPGRAFSGRVVVSLEQNVSGGEVYAESSLEGIGPEWKKFEFELRPDSADPQARFVIQIFGEGAVWADRVSLFPAGAEAGLRPDVVKKIQELRPAFLRWPGGNVAQDYHWKWGVGPRAERPAWINMSWEDELESAAFGTAEYIALCRLVGAEPTIVVNVEGRGATAGEAARLKAAGRDIRTASRKATAEDAADWVEYCNSPADSGYGRLRAADGHPEPFAVKYWEIGNEIWGDWVRGHSDAAAYAANARRYIRAMKAVDPGIQIIAVGHNDMEWNRVVLREIGGEIDYLSIHHYEGAGDSRQERRRLLNRPLWYEDFYKRVKSLIDELVPEGSVKLAINEWNTSLPLPRQHTMEPALFGARLMNVFERQGGVIGMSSVSDLVNGWSGGIIQASRRRVFTTPAYAVIREYNRRRGSWRIAAEASGPGAGEGDSNTGGKLDFVASTNKAGSGIYLKVVNTSLEDAVSARIRLSGVEGGVAAEAEAVTIRGSSLAARNDFEHPGRVGAHTAAVRADTAGEFSHSFPKHSVTVMRFRAARAPE